MKAALCRVVGYLKARLGERSTWLLIGTAVGAAAALVWPWSLVAVIVGTIAALVPDNQAPRP